MTFYDLLIPVLIILGAIVGIGVVFGALYTRTTRDKAYVRTGLGGKVVILDGGSVVLPVFHSIAWVGLNTLRLEVRRAEKESLITRDRMRADISAEFYVRVKPTPESIGLAAQTLGDRTNDADELRSLIEAKFVDALRSVAAEMTLVELQEKRSDFVKRVQETVAADLVSNGLELETVSLTKLDQTDKQHFNENNTFDAEGLTALTRNTESRRNERNTVTRDTEVAIAEKDREAALRQFEIRRATREAELNQERDIANVTARTRAETAAIEQTARLSEERARIEREQAVAEREAEALKARESARIASERDVRIVEQDSAIAIAERSKAESEAHANAEEARALSVSAEERVATARAVEMAERERKVTVIAAQQEAQRAATAITVQAEAEKEAAENRATAVRIEAAAESEANQVRAQGIESLGNAEAARERVMNEARNLLSQSVIEFELTRERIRIIPEALGETMRAVEKISEIRIIDAGGMLGRGGPGMNSGPQGVDGFFDKLLSYQAHKPIIDEVLKGAGFSGVSTMDALTSGLVPAKAAQLQSDEESRGMDSPDAATVSPADTGARQARRRVPATPPAEA